MKQTYKTVFERVGQRTAVTRQTRESGVLYDMKHFGVHYDDLEICNGQGVYKNGSSKLQEQLNQIKNYNLSAQIKTNRVKEDEVFVYPNPATTDISIGCINGKEIIIYDLLGNILLTKKLDKSLGVNKLDVSILHTGTYLYKIYKTDNTVFNGKLIIE